MLYKNCRELPIHNFNEIMITGDLQYLIKDGSKHSHSKLYQKWFDIIDEWNEYFGIGKREISKKTRVIHNQAQLLCLQNIHKLRNVLSKEQFIDSLKVWRLSPKNYVSRINTLTNKVNADLGYLKNKKSGKFDLDYTLTIISENGMKLNRFIDPVSEFASCLKRIKEKNKPDGQ